MDLNGIKQWKMLGLWLLVMFFGACADAGSGRSSSSGDAGVDAGIDAGAEDAHDSEGADVTDAGADGVGDVNQDPEGDASGDVQPPRGCRRSSTGVTQGVVEMTVDGLARSFRYTAPATEPGVPLPVLMAFHGGGGAQDAFPQQGSFDQLAASEGFIMVYPEGALVAPNEGEWQLNTTEDALHDIHFLEAIIQYLAFYQCVDVTRVYATGYSLGSMFTYEVACQMNDRVAGTMPVNPSACVLQENIGVMHIHGQDDWLIPYGSQWDWKEWDPVGTMMDIPGLVEFWRQKNNCQGTSEPSSADGQHVVHSECDGGARVEHHGLAGVEHNWPESINGVSTHQVIWDFVSGFERPLAPWHLDPANPFQRDP